MGEKIIVLNSGGFDSVTLLNLVCAEYPEAEITSLFFNYQQRNLEKEREKSREAVSKLNKKGAKINHLEIDIPPIFWTNSSLYYSEGDINNQYIEMRNLIFISYALSLAEHIKANKIYMAIIDGGNYTDTSKKFIRATKKYIKDILNIDYETPFLELTKIELSELVKKFNISLEDSFSCNTPVKDDNGNLIPCGKCGDCKDLELVKKLLDNDEETINFVRNSGVFYFNKIPYSLRKKRSLWEKIKGVVKF